MEGVVAFVSLRLSDLLDDLFHMPFPKLMLGAVVLGFVPILISALPDGVRELVRAGVLGALGVVAMLVLFTPLDWGTILR